MKKVSRLGIFAAGLLFATIAIPACHRSPLTTTHGRCPDPPLGAVTYRGRATSVSSPDSAGLVIHVRTLHEARSLDQVSITFTPRAGSRRPLHVDLRDSTWFWLPALASGTYRIEA